MLLGCGEPQIVAAFLTTALLWKLAIGIGVAVPCAMLGCYLVLRRMSLLGDAISHGVLPGIVVAALLSGQVSSWLTIPGAMAFGVLTALLTQALHRWSRTPEDASMGIVFTCLFALGVVILSQNLSHAHIDTECVLYGEFEFVPFDTFEWMGWEIPYALPPAMSVAVLTVFFVLLLWKELKLVSFDPESAAILGWGANLLHYALMAMVAAVTVVAFRVVGSILVIAMLIVPAATAQLLCDRLWIMVASAVGVAIVAAATGIVLAHPMLLETNSAGMMTVAAGVIFAIAVLFAPRHGVVTRSLRPMVFSIRIRAEDILAGLYRRDEAEAAGAATAVAEIEATLRNTLAGWRGWLARQALMFRGYLGRDARGRLDLTERGRRYAKVLVRAHRLWESYLQKHLPLPADHLHDPAERMEHYIGPKLQDQLAEELAQPDIDPHGKKIPPAADSP